MFEALLLDRANTQAKEAINRSVNRFIRTNHRIRPYGEGKSDDLEDSSMHSNQQEILRHLQIPGTSVDAHQEDFDLDRKLDAWTEQRKFNPMEWYRASMQNEAEAASKSGNVENSVAVASQAESAENETDISNIAVFEEKYGCSMLKKWHSSSKLPSGNLDFEKNLDMWAEMPKYTNDMYFLYVIVRRRNTYAVVFDINGKCIHAPLSAGKAGLKNSDKGWRSEGSAVTGNIVTSKYLDMVYPKLCQLEEAQNRYKTGVHKGRKPIQVVLRVMGWYNGRQGALKALNDRRDKYQVCYFEDITPVPRNGPRMPKIKRR